MIAEYILAAFIMVMAALAFLYIVGKIFPPSCTWTRVEEFDDTIWSTECGEEFCFVEQGPEENGAKFCHNCGRPVSLFIPEPEGEEDER